MNILYTSLFTQYVLIVTTSFSQQLTEFQKREVQTEREKRNYTKNVKSVEITFYSDPNAKKDIVKSSKIRSGFKATFTTKGDYLYTAEGSYITSYNYDSKGRLKKEKLTSPKGGYDKRFASKGDTSFWFFKKKDEGERLGGYIRYNASGKKIEQVYYDLNKKKSSSEYWKFDQKGNLTSVYRLHGESVAFWMTWEYDSLFRLVKEISHMGKEPKSIFEYNSKNQLVKITKSAKDNIIFETIELSYNASNKKISEKTTKSNGTVYDEHKYFYDSKGHLTEEIFGSSRREVHRYDNQGNPIMTLIYIDNTLKHIYDRKFTYF